MASSTSRCDFNGEEVSQLASCTDQAELLYTFKCILHAKSIDPSAVYAPTTLGTSTDYGASVLPKFFETQSRALHFEVGYAITAALDTRFYNSVKLRDCLPVHGLRSLVSWC